MDDGSDADVDCRIKKAKGAFGMLAAIWKNNAYPKAKSSQF